MVQLFCATSSKIGAVDDLDVKNYVIKNGHGSTMEVIDFGASLKRLLVRDRNGELTDVVLGYDNLDGYLENKRYMGCIVGRVCNRIGNGTFKLNGKEYHLTKNSGPHHLHGGLKGFSHRVWQSTLEGNKVRFSYISADGEENYPGTLTVVVTYELTNSNEIFIDFQAACDEPTPVNLTNHSYFNLDGAGAPTIFDHQIKLNAEKYLVRGDDGLVTGEIRDVNGTPFDFRDGRANLGERIKQVRPIGFDHCFCVPDWNGSLKQIASCYSPKTGIKMDLSTTQRGVHFYTAHFMDQTGKGGKSYAEYSGFALEAEGYPNALNEPNFPSIVLKPGERYRHQTMYKFSVVD